ncbi:MAG TPA: hypothetical protein VL854_00820 [Nitrososphaeraceae archaeon]|nr:hypothetical protein [Nitrososphaeraceae archaeon]
MAGWAARELMHRVNELIFYSVGGIMTLTGIILVQEFIYGFLTHNEPVLFTWYPLIALTLVILGTGSFYAGYRKN